MKLPGSLQQLMQQAQQMQESMQQEIDRIQVESSVGGGTVKIRMDGKKNLLDIQISPEVAGEVEMLRELILSAAREASTRVDEAIKNRIGSQVEGLGLPSGVF